MIRRRREREQTAPDEQTASEPTEAASTPTRPRDSTEASADEPGYVDLGPLRIRGRVGFQLQVPQDDGGGAGSVVLVTEEAGLELRAFAAPRSGGLWDEVRQELVAEVQRLDGQVEEVDGPYGPELRVQIPVTLPDGQDGFQPSRIVAVEGPRWMLRATFLGSAALEPDDDGLLEQAFREVVVVRGDDPRPVREPLLIELPPDAEPMTLGPDGEPT
ncbi:hypothetical protein QE370_002810 [Aeromicrobium sp. SORGH_AS981]|uniref:DUF3710 domain-containing protein n=1 Tax=Aeromicrobium sp. SORGH_AS_0981 TaxID=3041802 RepID=UPI00285DFEF5|nr:DUF3710 domain-containing protein [Aeromicrobium sp. SORGH_AS_0981]MDR6119626.1 hypothetical protein [Aeromicrobium sp. SORGH_AS_0981]